MNLNDLVVPNNKTSSIKLNARNLQQLQLDTTTLASESKEMEKKLEQLKEDMSKEKEGRGHLRDFRWRFGKSISSNSNSQPDIVKTTNYNTFQKLSAGRLKIRVLKDESLRAPVQSAPSPSVPNSGLGMTSRSREKGMISRQFEIKTAELTDTQAHVISQNISCFQRQINPGSFPGTYNPDSSTSPDPNHTITSYTITRRVDESLENGTKVKEKQMKIPHNCSQVLVVKHGEEKTVGAIEGDKSELANFTGLYSEEESARSFQEALIQWRQERIDGKRKLVTTDVPWRPALVSATSTQTDLPPDRESEGQNREGAEQKLTVKLEFTENSLTYMDRLLLKKHRRTPVESPPSLAFGMDIKSLPTTDTEEDMVSSLTAEEEDFQQYWSSLFNVPVSKDRNEPQVSTSGLCLNIEVLDEICRDIKKVSFSEQELDNNIMVSKADHSSPCPNHPPRPSITSVQQKTGRKPHCPQDQNSKINDSANASTSDCGTSACITAGTSKKSAKPPTSHASRSIRSPTINKLEDNCGSPRFFPSLPDSQFIIHKSSQPSDLFTTDVSILDFATSVIPEENLSPSSSLSFSLRSTFSVSPSDSTQCVLLPKVCHSTPQQSDTKKPQSSQLFAETISSVNPYETPRSNLISPHQFQLPSSEPDCLLLDNQLTHSLSPGTVKPQPTSKALESIISIANPVPDNGPPYFCHKSVLKYEDAGGHKSTPSCKEAHCTSPNSVPNLTDNVVETEEEKYLEESEDEMSSDSLNLTLPEDDSCREEAQVMQNQTAGFGSEQFCDLDGFSPLGLDTDTGCPGSPVHSRSDGLHTCQFSVRDSDPTEFAPAGFTLSQASQAIMEICSVDQTGCEDPDVDTDMTAHILHSMEQELRLVANTQCIRVGPARNKTKKRRLQREVDRVP